MTFRKAVSSSPMLMDHYQDGLGALGRDSSRISTNMPRAILGSLNVEKAQRKISHQHHTWDYGVGFTHDRSEFVIWIEVYDANSSHVRIILKKFAALKQFLDDHAALFNQLPGRYIWLATGSVAIAPNTQERRRLNGHGIVLRSKQLVLESVM
jgi:hypothetical protein